MDVNHVLHFMNTLVTLAHHAYCRNTYTYGYIIPDTIPQIMECINKEKTLKSFLEAVIAKQREREGEERLRQWLSL